MIYNNQNYIIGFVSKMFDFFTTYFFTKYEILDIDKITILLYNVVVNCNSYVPLIATFIKNIFVREENHGKNKRNRKKAT